MSMLFETVGAALIAVCGGAVGSLITLNVLKVKVQALEEWRKDVKKSVVYKDACAECKSNWTGQISDLREDMKDGMTRLDEKLDRVLERLAAR